MNKHNLSTGFKRFDPYFPIAESWKRLAFFPNEIQPHDLTLLEHEKLEIKYIVSGFSQDKAHRMASMIYNYDRESSLFYESLNLKNKAKTEDETIEITRSRY